MGRINKILAMIITVTLIMNLCPGMTEKNVMGETLEDVRIVLSQSDQKQGIKIELSAEGMEPVIQFTGEDGSAKFLNVDKDKVYTIKVKRIGYAEYIKKDAVFQSEEYVIVDTLEWNGIFENGSIVKNEDGSITVNADDNYVIDKLKVDGKEIEEAKGAGSFTHYEEGLEQDKDITAEFKLKTSKIKFGAVSNGRIQNVNGQNIDINAEGKTEDETEYTKDYSFKPVAEQNYEISSVSVNGKMLDSDESGYYKISNISKDEYQIEVKFEIKKADIKFHMDKNGEIIDSDGNRHSVTANQEKVIQADYGTAYEFTPVVLDNLYIKSVTLTDGTNLTEDEYGVYTIPDISKDNYEVNIVFAEEVRIEDAGSAMEVVCDSRPKETRENKNEDGTSTYTYIYKKDVKNVQIKAKAPYVQIGQETIGKWGNKMCLPEDSIDTATTAVFKNINVFDNSRDSYSIDVIIKIIIDSQKPEIKESQPAWLNHSGQLVKDGDIISSVDNRNKLELKGSVSDKGESGISTIYYSTDASAYDRFVQTGSEEGIISDNSAYTQEKIVQTGVDVFQESGSWNIQIDKPDNDITYYIWACDKSENISEPKEFTIKVDDKSPEIDNITQSSKVANEKVRVSGKITEDKSGVSKIRYAVTSEAAAEDTYLSDISNSDTVKEITNYGDGRFHFDVDSDEETPSFSRDYYVWCYDNAGNKSEPQSVHITIDKDHPVIEELNVETVWYNSENQLVRPDSNTLINSDSISIDGAGRVTVKGDISDSGFGGLDIGKVFFSTNENDYNSYLKDEIDVDQLMQADSISSNGINGEGRENGEWSKTFSVDKSTKYYVWVCDNAGNASESYISFEIKVDKTAPQIKNLNYDADIISNKNVKITFDATDIEGTSPDAGHTVSGIAEVRYSTDKTVAEEDVYTDNPNEKTVYESKKTDGKYEIEIKTPENVSLNQTYYIWAYDKAGNKSDIVSRNVILDKEPPTVKDLVVTRTGSVHNEWSSGKVDVIVNCEDKGGSGYFDIYYDTQENYLNGAVGTKVEKNEAGQYFVTFEDEQNQNYVFWAIDEAGNKSVYNESENLCKIRIDKTSPKIKRIEIKEFDIGITPLHRLINKRPFGLFYNDTILVEVEADDSVVVNGTVVSSEIKEIRLLYGENGIIEPYEIISGEGNHSQVAKFKVSPYFKGTLTVQAADNVNIPTEVLSGSENATGMEGVANNRIHLEIMPPEVSAIISGDNEYESWYSGDITFQITYSDNETDVESGLSQVRAVITTTDSQGNVTTEDVINAYPSEKNQTWKYIQDICTSALASSPDGKYVLKLNAKDNAGNDAEEKTYVVNKDTKAPVITGFEFLTNGYKEADGSVLGRAETDYGFYFTENVNIVITAKDEGHASGVKSITYYLKSAAGTESEKKTVQVDENNQITISVPKDFKGQIYAKATDNVNNTPEYFVTPSGIITESSQKHGTEQHITFTKPASTAKDTSGIDLYRNDTDVQVTVSDIFSGIRKIEWSVTAPYDKTNNQQGTIEIKNDKTYIQDSDTGWTQLKTDRNLVTEMVKTIRIKHNSNNIILTVKVTDRAGNVTENSMVLSIDKTAPVYTVTYDNNSPDNTYTNIYKSDRTATIVITERNFDKNNFIAEISNTDGFLPELSGWTAVVDNENPDNSKYMATIRYSADGDYEFNMSFKDMAGNEAPVFEKQSFTIDKTLPFITVRYNNDNFENGNYYKAERSAVITINEHNFDSSRVRITGMAVDNGNPAAFPEIGAWNSDGDIHTAVLHYTADGFYTFDIDYTDMAGNDAGDYIAEEFYIDKTPPVLEITGVEDKSANKGEIAPVIIFGDTNYNPGNTVITLTGVNSGTKEIQGKFENTVNGQIFRFDNLENIQSNDDIYTLTAFTKDMAGNEVSKSITFSVNRFGSVYTMDSRVQAISKKFVKSTDDIIIFETNVDSLDMTKIKVRLTKNGKPVDLVLDKDFTIEQTGGNGSWCQYRYCINKDLFKDDGTYIITVYSVDAAGNINENDDDSKRAEISFGIDNTNPVIIPIDIEKEKTYAVKRKPVNINIKDNLMLANVEILLNGEPVDYLTEEENYSFEMLSSNKKQNIKIVAEDAAGNTHEMNINNVLVSTNLFVRWYNNKMAVGTTVGGVVLFAGLITGIIIWKKRREDARSNSNL